MKRDRVADQPMSQRAYARRRGVRHGAVQEAIQTGRLRESLVRGKGGVRIRPDAADEEWERNTHPGERRGDAAPSAGDFGPSSEYRHVLSVEKAAKARLAMLELSVREGRVVEAAAVERAQFDAARRVREKVLAMPDKLAKELALESDAARVRKILDRECREALNGLADGFAVKEKTSLGAK